MSKRNLSEKERELIMSRTLTNDAKMRMYKEFLDDPKLLPFILSGRRCAFPGILVDNFKPNPIEGRAPIERLPKEMDEEGIRLSKKAWPIVAYDPKLVEDGYIKEGEINYAIYIHDQNSIKGDFFYKGLPFVIVDFFNILSFFKKSDLPLLSSEVPVEELEKQKKIEEENESKI